MSSPENPYGPDQPSYVVPPWGTTPDAGTPVAPPAAGPEPLAAPTDRRSGVGTYAALAAAGLVIGAAGTWALGTVNADAVAGTVDRASAGQQGGFGGQGTGQGPATDGGSNGMVPPGTSTDSGTGANGSGTNGSDGTQGWAPPSGTSGSGQQGTGGMQPPPGGMGPGGGHGPSGTSGGS